MLDAVGTTISPTLRRKFTFLMRLFSTFPIDLCQPTTIGSDKSKNSLAAAKIISNSKVICFDVDSTVIQEEGIDELAKFCGKGDEVARLTKEAMKGSMTFQEALRLRLNIIRPSQMQIANFLQQNPSTLSPGIK